jgi:hypothetical protein
MIDQPTSDRTRAAVSQPAASAQHASDFVLLEYKQCIDLIKYYDQRQADLVKFISGLSAAVPSVFFAFAKLGNETLTYFWPFVAIVSTFTSVGIFSIFTALVQVRAYFTYAARQANSIRLTMTRHDPFFANRLWTNPDRPAFDWNSAHTVQFAFACVQGALFAGVAVFAALYEWSASCGAVLASIFVILVTIVGITLTRSYLRNLPLKPDSPPANAA